MNRRRLLRTLGAALAGAVLDPEKALWIPGRKVISIPKPRKLTLHEQYVSGRMGEFVAFEWYMVRS